MAAHPPIKAPEFRSHWYWDDRGRSAVADDMEAIRKESAIALSMFEQAMRGRLAAWLAENAKVMR